MDFSTVRQRLTGGGERSLEPLCYAELLDDVKLWLKSSDAKAFLENPVINQHQLQTLRSLALHEPRGLTAEAAGRLRDAGRTWCRFLLGDGPAASSSYLAQERLGDDVFYHKQPKNRAAKPRPLPRGRWPAQPAGKCTDTPPVDDWSKQLGWLRHPEFLTSTEMELALLAFRWKCGTCEKARPELRTCEKPQPELRTWLKESPHMLHRIHGFLLRRYCFTLLEATSQAAKAAGFSSPAHRAGELWGLFPRSAGLAAVGLLAFISYDDATKVFFAAPASQLVYALAPALVALWLIVHIDVFKQNRGVMVSYLHALPRTLRQWRWFLYWGVLLAGLYTLFFRFGPLALCMAVQSATPPRVVLGVLTLGAASAALGAVLQWFWDDKSAAEPV
jgi:hypothetical protein